MSVKDVVVTYPGQPDNRSSAVRLIDEVRPLHPGRVPVVIGTLAGLAFLGGAVYNATDQAAEFSLVPDYSHAQAQAQTHLIQMDPTATLQVAVGKYKSVVDAEGILYNLKLKTPDPLGGIGVDTPDPTYPCDLNRRGSFNVTARYTVPAKAVRTSLAPTGATTIVIDGSKLGVTTGLEADAGGTYTDFVVTDGKKDFGNANNTCMAFYKANAGLQSLLGKLTPDFMQLTPEDMLEQMLKDADNHTNAIIRNTAFQQTEKCSNKPEIRNKVSQFTTEAIKQYFTALAGKQPNTKLGTVTFADGNMAITKDKTAEIPVPPMKTDGSYQMSAEIPQTLAVNEADSTCETLEAVKQ